MTRQEFLDNVTEWWELVNFCEEMGCDYCKNIYDDETRDDFINERLVDMAQDETWTNLLDALQGLYDTSGYSYYKLDGYDDWEGLTEYDFSCYKDDVCTWMDDNDYWDDEDEEEAPVTVPPEDTTPVEAEEFSIDELMMASVAVLH